MVLRKGRRNLGGFALHVALLALLLLLAGLQYRWTGAVSRAEEARLRANLDSTLARFARDFDEELARVTRLFSSIPARELPEALAELRRDARHPDLVQEVYRLGFEDGRVELMRAGEHGTLSSAPWPSGLERLRDRHAERHGRGSPRPRPIAVLSEEPLTLMVAPPGPRGMAATLIVFRNDAIQEHLLPELVPRHFGSGEALDYDIVVLDESHRVVYSSRAEAVRALDAPDASAKLLGFHGPFGRPRLGRELPEGRWTVLARHRAGSLESVVGRARARNLALGSGVLLVLAVSIVLVTISARRAMELGERKMEFVAGVSHELRTPLAIIRSAAQNLKDGSVSGPEQVERYGGLIEAEGRRLGDLVEKVLELAGVQSQSRSSVRERVKASSVARAAIEDCAPATRDRGIAVETSFGAEDLEILGDEDALRRGIANLVANAVKHGDGASPIAVGVESRNGNVVITVSDRGPGIHPSDLPHLFEAFYRGRSARERQVPGSGLGLSLVRHIARDHGGSVEVESAPGKGSRFCLVLPRAPRGPVT